jgi:hypothetical protein
MICVDTMNLPALDHAVIAALLWGFIPWGGGFPKINNKMDASSVSIQKSICYTPTEVSCDILD